MPDSITAKHLARLASLTNSSAVVLQRMLENSKELSVWMKGKQWIEKQKGLVSSAKKPEGVPEHVSTCFNKLVEHIRKPENICQEGLFRKSGSIHRQCSLKLQLQQGAQIDSAVYTVHDCTAVLKAILADMPEPLLTSRLCRIYAFVHGNARVKDRKIEAIGILTSLLPASTHSIARSLFCLLHDVVEHGDETKMTSSSLATIFAPHVMCSRQMTPSELLLASHKLQSCVAFLVEHAYSIFKVASTIDQVSVPNEEAGRSTSTSMRSVAIKVESTIDQVSVPNEEAGRSTSTSLRSVAIKVESTIDQVSVPNEEAGRSTSTSVRNVTTRQQQQRRSAGEKRRHSDRGVTSEKADRDTATGRSSPKRRSEHEHGILPSFNLIPVVRLVRLSDTMLMASPFSRRDGAVRSARPTERPPLPPADGPSGAGSADSFRRPPVARISLVRLPSVPVQNGVLPPPTASRGTSVADGTTRTTKPPKPLPRRLQVSGELQPTTPRKNTMLQS